MVIEYQPYLITLGILTVENLQKFNEIRALVGFPDKRNRFSGHQIKSGKQRQCTMTDILIIPVSGAISFTGRKIRRSCGNCLNPSVFINKELQRVNKMGKVFPGLDGLMFARQYALMMLG